MKAAVGRARFRQEITEVLEQTPTNKPIVQLVSAAKPRDVSDSLLAFFLTCNSLQL